MVRVIMGVFPTVPVGWLRRRRLIRRCSSSKGSIERVELEAEALAAALATSSAAAL